MARMGSLRQRAVLGLSSPALRGVAEGDPMTTDDTMTTGAEWPVIVLSSGQTLMLKRILLYDDDAVMVVAALRAHAAKGLGPTGYPGVGILGTPSLEFGTEVAGMLLVSGIISGAVQATAFQFLNRSQEQHELLSRHGVFFDADKIKDIQIPRPSAWSASGDSTERTIAVGHLWKFEKELLLKKYGKSERDVRDGNINMTGQPRYVHNGDDFLFVSTNVGDMYIRWSQVAAYHPPASRP
jgi:hypothetical protein